MEVVVDPERIKIEFFGYLATSTDLAHLSTGLEIGTRSIFHPWGMNTPKLISIQTVCLKRELR